VVDGQAEAEEKLQDLPPRFLMPGQTRDNAFPKIPKQISQK
jgi:hypothetical protein